jgi:hypothetical protein
MTRISRSVVLRGELSSDEDLRFDGDSTLHRDVDDRLLARIELAARAKVTNATNPRCLGPLSCHRERGGM